MPSYRRLPSGRWQVEVLLPVRLPSGRQKRATRSHVSKGTLREWATALEAAIDSGTWVEPRAGDVTLREYHERWVAHRLVAGTTTAKNESHWRNHVEPALGGYPVSAITRPTLRRWVKVLAEETCAACLTRPGLTKGGVLVKHKRTSGQCSGSGGRGGLGGWTVQGVVSTLSAILSGAVEDGMLPGNPALGLRLPRIDPKPVFFWTRPQAAKILDELGDHALMCDLDFHVGLRIGELTGLRRRYVDTSAGLIHVVGVQTRDGWREYPKSRLSRRTVPIPDKLLERMSVLCEPLGPDDFVFAAPEGGAWDDTNFRRRVFQPAVEEAGVPMGSPHDMRHTAASWLVQRGVDLYRVQALLGHESFRTTQRYAHLQPDAFDKIREAWA